MESRFFLNRFSMEQQRELAPLITAEYEYLFHCTPASCNASIQETGLDISKCEEDYRGKDEALTLRYCTHKELPSIYRMKRDFLNSDIPIVPSPVSIVKVKSRSIVNRNFGFDWTASQTVTYTERHFGGITESEMNSMQAMQLLASIGILSCYETIPPQEIEFMDVNEDFPHDIWPRH